jgi:hypothetical protein
MSARECRIPATNRDAAGAAAPGGKVTAFHFSVDGGNREQVTKRVRFGEFSKADWPLTHPAAGELPAASSFPR